MKKKYLLLFVSALLLFVAAAGLGVHFWQQGRYQDVSLKGYGLSLPPDWEIKAEERELIFSREGLTVGRFTLLYQDAAITALPALFGYGDVVPNLRESDQYVTKVYELSFTFEGQAVLQYVFDAVPAAPPYKLVLTLTDSSAVQARKILESVTLPSIGDFAPPKPVGEPTAEELEQAVYTVENNYGVFAYNVSALNFGQARPEPLSVLSYGTREGARYIKSWYKIVCHHDKQYLFTYYQAEDGQYIYDNEPLLIKQLTRETSEEENYTRYLADGQVIIEAPYNQYAEEKSVLLSYKGSLLGDENIDNLVMAALPAGVVLENITEETADTPYGLTLAYTLTKDEQYSRDGVLDEAVFYQNGLVLLSLIDNADWIQINIQSGDKVHQVVCRREAAEQQFENQDLRGFANDEESFGKFAENIPKIEPPGDGGSGNKADGTRAITSRTVTVSSSQYVKHPRTGQMVSVLPYAERYGVSQYLDKPITVTLYEKVENGETVMWAEAVCGGAALGTYPINSRTEFDNLVAMAG